MQQQLAYLMKEKAHTSNSGTIYVDLPSNEVISMIMVDFSITNGTTRLYTRSILDVVKKVEVLLEGSKTAYSVKPEVGSYLAFLQSGTLPPHKLYDGPNSAGNTMALPIYFGRYPGDPEYALDTGQYSNAQLLIEYELDTTYDGSTTAEVTVWFMRPIDMMTPRGFIRSRTVHEFDSGASAGETQVDLPTGLPWYNVGFRYFDVDRYLRDGVTDVDLDIDEGRLHLFDGRIEDLLMLQQLKWGGYVEGPIVYSAPLHSEYVQSFMGVVEHAEVIDFNVTPDWFSIASWNGQRLAVGSLDYNGTPVAAARASLWRCTGIAPFGGLLLFDGSEGPFNAPAHADAKITYVNGAYDGNYQTFVQEVVEGAL